MYSPAAVEQPAEWEMNGRNIARRYCWHDVSRKIWAMILNKMILQSETYQISEWSDNSKPMSRESQASRDLVIRRPSD